MLVSDAVGLLRLSCDGSETSTWHFEVQPLLPPPPCTEAAANSPSPPCAEAAAAAAVAAGSCAKELLVPLLTAARSNLLRHYELFDGTAVFTHPKQAAAIKGCDQTGCQLWFTATVLLDYVHSTRCIAPGSRVGELGAGCGAVGLALHFGQHQCDVVVTDVPEQLPLLHLNVGHNLHRLGSVRKRPTVAPLSWGEAAAASAVLSAAGGHFDVIIGSDIAYEQADHHALLATMAALAHGQPTPAHGRDIPPASVLLAVADWMQPGQTHSRSLGQGFLATAAALGWTWEVAQTVHQEEAAGRAAGCAQLSDTVPMPVVILRGQPPPKAPIAYAE